MRITTQKTWSPNEREVLKQWAVHTLKATNFVGGPLPGCGTTYFYIDNQLTFARGGGWRDFDGSVYLAGASSDRMPPQEKLAILVTLCRIWRISDDPDVVEAIAVGAEHAIRSTLLTIYNSFVAAEVPPSRIAFSRGMDRIAVQFAGERVWRLPSGLEAEVDDTWTVMDC